MILDQQPSRPFDASRSGLNLGEGAGFVVLVSEEVVRHLGLSPRCVVSGYAEPNKRTSGFRLFREGSATKQTFKLNVGTGTSDSWFDGGDAASINPAVTTGWIHVAFTISQTKAAVYINGNLVSSGNF